MMSLETTAGLLDIPLKDRCDFSVRVATVLVFPFDVGFIGLGDLCLEE